MQQITINQTTMEIEPVSQSKKKQARSLLGHVRDPLK